MEREIIWLPIYLNKPSFCTNLRFPAALAAGTGAGGAEQVLQANC